MHDFSLGKKFFVHNIYIFIDSYRPTIVAEALKVITLMSLNPGQKIQDELKIFRSLNYF